MNKASKQKGQLSLQVLIYGSIAIILLSGFLVWADMTIKSVLRYSDRALAFTISEAGIEYYRWHLAHAPTDYQDGTGETKPYVHDFYDKDNNLMGQFILNITPPPVGSSVVVIESKGYIINDPTIEKIIKVRMSIPSFARYAVVTDESVRLGTGTEVSGLVHSNNGIRFDGLAHNIVTSAASSTYDDPDHSGDNEYGVHTHVNLPPGSGVDDSFRPLEAPPNSLASRPDVFQIGRQVSVPAVNFSGITQNLSIIRDSASSSGFYSPSSTAYGYDVLLKENNTFDLYRVTAVSSTPNGCTNSSHQDGWGSWTVGTEVLIGNYQIPSNGLIFLEDDIWVRGKINKTRVTIASARFPDNSQTRSSINITDNILYTNFDGQDVIGLIAQKNINVGMYSQDNLTIDAAMIAQNGRIGRYYYRPPSQSGQTNSRCAPWHIRNSITTYGMIASSKRYGFAYVDFDGQNTGYQIRNLMYDSNLLYSPPPSFPLISNSYQTISWEEVK